MEYVVRLGGICYCRGDVSPYNGADRIVLGLW